jgi:V8-like Glu-specific endopeptidase
MTLPRLRTVLALCLAIALPGGAAAKDAPLKRMLTADDSRGWEAVGRLDMAGRAFCTGALIAPDLVLTAAHCLYDRDTGRAFEAGEMTFLAGWRNGRAEAYRTVRRALPHPEYDFAGADRVARVRHDVAILELAQPIRLSGVTPFATEGRPARGDSVGVVSYAHDRAEAPSIQEVCDVLGRQSGVLMMSCSVDFGSSGAPIFVLRDGVARIVSVVSAKAEVGEKPVALGSVLDGTLDDLRALVGRVPVVPAGQRQTAGGAKFLRP